MWGAQNSQAFQRRCGTQQLLSQASGKNINADLSITYTNDLDRTGPGGKRARNHSGCTEDLSRFSR